MAVREQIAFVTGFARERLVIRYGAHLRHDPLARLHLREGRQNPYPIYDEVRSRGPLIPSTMSGLGMKVWTSASYQVCEQVLKDRGFGVDMRGGNEPAGSPQLSFLEMDPPEHTRLRRFVAPTFSPKAVSGFAPQVTQTVTGLLDAVPADGGFDLVRDYAASMPIAVITSLLGIPDADSAEFQQLGATFGSALGGLQSLRHARELFEAQQQLKRIFTQLFELRRTDPGDDVISRMVSAPESQVTPEEMVPLCTLLLLAGFETTVNLIGNTVLALLERPDLWRRVVAEPSLVEAAVEETLRFDPPVQRTARVARVAAEVGGRRVNAGDLVITLIGGTGRDPEVVDRPDDFDLDRTHRDHLAFSAGQHYCIGAPLAKLEATIAVRELVCRFPDLTLRGPLERRAGSLIRGLASMPVHTTPAGRPSYAVV